MIRFLIIGLITASCSTLACAFGQSSFGSIVGTVRDASGCVVPGCKITVLGNAKSAERVTFSDREGSYRVANLEPGTYTVFMEADGFHSATYIGVALLAPQAIRVDGCAEPAAQTESDDVFATSELGINMEIPVKTKSGASTRFDSEGHLDWTGDEMGEPIFNALWKLLPGDDEDS